MKYSVINIFLLFLFCYACNNRHDNKKAALLEQADTVTVVSPYFDIICDSAQTLSPREAIPVLLRLSERPAIEESEFKKKEMCLIKAYDIANTKQKKAVLYRMVVFYYEELYLYVPGLENYALAEGYRRCRELESGYSLSEKEWEDITVRKAEYLRWMEQYETVINLHNELLAFYTKRDDALKMISQMRAIAVLFNLMGDMAKSWEMNRKAYEVSEKKGVQDKQLGILSGMAMDAYALGHYEESLRLLKKLSFLLGKDNQENVNFKIAENYVGMDKYNIARNYFRKVLDQGNRIGRSTVYISIADTYVREERIDSAELYFRKAISDFRVSKEKQSGVFGSKLNLPYCSFPMCIRYARLLEKNGKTEAGLGVLDIMRPMAYSELARYNLKNAIEALKVYASFYRSSGEFAKAFEALDRRDSLTHYFTEQEKEKNFGTITRRYKNKEFIDSIDWKEKQIEYSKRTLVLSMFLIVLLVGIVTMLWWMYTRKRQQLSLIYNKQQEIDNLKKGLQQSDQTVDPEESLFKKTDEVMSSRYLYRDPELSLEFLSRLMNVNRTYLSACINNRSGKNFNQWLNGYRIRYVIERLDEDTDIQALYREAGFSSLASFYRSFKQYTSMSPKQYVEWEKDHK